MAPPKCALKAVVDGKARIVPNAIVSVVWLASLYAWLSNIIYQATLRQYSNLIVLILLLPSLVILYFAEGVEIAVADLRDKDVDQFNNQSTRRVFIEIQNRDDFFISHRQIFAVANISFMSLLAANVVKTLYVYGYGEVKDWVVQIVNFIFITLLILWLCQVAPKRLAAINSERFLSQAQFLWPLIKYLGVLNIPGPSGFIVSGLQKLSGVTRRKLLPSRSAFFNIASVIHGYCIDQIEVNIAVKEDGSAEINRLYLMMFLNGRRLQVTGESWAGNPPKRFVNKIELCEAWKLPAVEDLKIYEAVLDEIFASAKNNDNSVAQILVREGYEQLNIAQSACCTIPDPDQNAHHDWQIEFLHGLPEGFNDPDRPIERIVCLLYKVSGRAPPGSFYFGNAMDYWTERVISACRKLHFMVKPAAAGNVRMGIQDCEVGLEVTEAKLPVEAARASSLLNKYGYIEYPIQSAVYKINWRSMGVSLRAQTAVPAETVEA
jgi:hypothetical protein